MAQVDRGGSVNISSDVAVANNGTVLLFQPSGPILGVGLSTGGTGYTVGDILTLDNGDGGVTGFGGKVTVLTAPGGIVGTVGLLNAGDGYNNGPISNNVYNTTGGTGDGLCSIAVSSIDYPHVEVTVKSIAASLIANVAGVQQGTVSILDGNTVLYKNYCPSWTAVGAGEGKSAYFPINETYRPARVLRVRYNAILNATTAAVNVVWSRGGG